MRRTALRRAALRAMDGRAQSADQCRLCCKCTGADMLKAQAHSGAAKFDGMVSSMPGSFLTSDSQKG